MKIGASALAALTAFLLIAPAARADTETADVTAALERLADVSGSLAGTGPLGRALPLTTPAPGGSAGIGLGDALAQATTDRLRGPSTLADVATQLSTGAVTLADGRTLTVAATAVPGPPDDLHLDVTLTRRVAGAPLSAGPLAAPHGATLDLRLHAVLDLDYDPGSRTSWLAGTPGLDLDATVAATAGASGGVGVLRVSLGSGTLTATVHLHATLGTPDLAGRVVLLSPDGSGTLVPGAFDALSLGAGYASGPASTIGGAVPVTADTSGGLASLGSLSGTLAVSDPDVAGGAPPTVSGLDALADFTRVTPSDLAAGVKQLAAFLDAAEQATSRSGGRTVGDVALPFMQGKLSDTFSAGDALDAFLAAHAPGGVPDFDSLQDMLAELDGAQGTGSAVTVDAPSWDGGTRRLAFGVHVAGARSNVALDPQEGGVEDPHVGEVTFGDALAAGGIHQLAAVHAVATASPSYQVDLTPVLDLEPDRSGLRTSDRIMLRTGGELLRADVPIHTAVDATGLAGPIDVHAGGTVDVAAPASGHMLDVALKSQGDVPLPQAAADLGGLVQLSGGGTATAALGLDVPDMPSFFGGGCANESAGSCTDVSVTLADIGDPSATQVSGPGLATLQAFAQGATDPATLLAKAEAGLTTLSGALRDLPALASDAGAAALAEQLPLTGEPLGALIDPSALDRAVDAVRAQSPASLDALASALDRALGDGSTITFRPSATAAGTPLLLAHLVDKLPVDAHVPLDLSLGAGVDGAGLVGASSTGTLHVTGEVDADVTVGIVVSAAGGATQPGDLLVLPSSALTAKVAVDGSGTLTATLGPLLARLGDGTTPAALRAAVDLSLADPSPGGDAVRLSDWASALRPQLNHDSPAVACGSEEQGYGLDVCLHAPLYLSTDGGRTFAPVDQDPAQDSVILRLPASDPTFDPSGPPIEPLSGTGPPLDRFHYPDGLPAALEGAALSLGTLRAGADQFLDLVAQGLGAASDDGHLPFVGSDLQEGQDFVAHLRTDLDQALDALPPTAGATVGDIRGSLRSELTSALGPLLQSGVTVTLQCGSAACQDAELGTSISSVAVAFDAGRDALSFGIPMSVGLPGLTLRSTDPDSDGIHGSLGWRLHVAMGLDAQGFFVSPGNRLSVGLHVTAPQSLHATLAVLNVDATDLNGGATPLFDGGLDIGLTNSGDEHLDDLLAQGAGALDTRLTAQAAADWHLQGGVNSALPGMAADFHLRWGWNDVQPDATAPTEIRFDNVSVVPGSVLQGVLGPVAQRLNQALEPFQGLFTAITAPLPVLSDLSHQVGGGDISVSSLLGISSDLSGDERLQMAHRAVVVSTMVNRISHAVGSDQPVPIGSFDVDGADALAGVAPESLPKNVQISVPQGDDLQSLLLRAMFPASQDADLLDELLDSDRGGFTFPALDDPTKLLGLLVGQDVDIVHWDAGRLDVQLGGDGDPGGLDALAFPLDVLMPVSVGATGQLSIHGHFGAGFDTYGIRRAVAGHDVAGVLDGLYVDSRDATGTPSPNLSLTGDVGLTAGFDVGLGSASAEGGLHFDGSLGVYDPGNTGKFRPGTATCVFGGHFDSYAFLNLSVTLGVSPFSHTWDDDVARAPLFDLSSSCPQPASGSGGGGGGGWVDFRPRPPAAPFGRTEHVRSRQHPESSYDIQHMDEQGDVVGRLDDQAGNPDVETDFTWSEARGSADVGDQGQPLGIADDGTTLFLDDDGHLRVGTATGVHFVRTPDDESADDAFLTDPAGACQGLVYGDTDDAAFVTSTGAHAAPVVLAEAPEPGGTQHVALDDVSPRGQVLGEGWDSGFFRLADGAWKPLDYRDVTIQQAFAINDDGDVLASLADGNAILRADGSVERLPDGYDLAPGRTLDDQGDVLMTRDADEHVVVWHHGRVYDLDALVDDEIDAAFAIDDRGQILIELFSPTDFDLHQVELLTVPSFADPSAADAPATGCAKPSAPVRLLAQSSGGAVQLSWVAAPSLVPVTAYHVYRFARADQLVHIGDVGGSATGFTDPSPPAGAVRYAVEAESVAGTGPVAVAAPDAGAARTTATPGQDTTLTLPGGHGELDLPGSLSATPTTFTYLEPASQGDPPGTFDFAGLTFSIVAEDALGQEVHQFPGSYTLKLHYDPAKLPSGSDESQLNLYYHQGDGWQAVLPCAGCSVDTNRHVLTAVLNHLTDFALGAPHAAVATPTPSPVPTVAPQPTPTVAPTPTPTPAPRRPLALRVGRIAVTRARVRVTVTNRNGFAIAARLVLSARGKRLAAATARLKAHRRATVTLRLRHRARGRATLALTTTAHGRSVTQRVRVRLR